MKLWETPNPAPGTFWYKVCEFFVNNINWCEAYYYGSDKEKPENKLYNFLYTYWLFPFKNNACLCCNTTRGVFYGLVLGFILGKLI